jgi:hypothetical protein
MRVIAAIVCFAISTVLLGFINVATYEAASSWGMTEAVTEITGTTYNIAVFTGRWVIGGASLWTGVSILHRHAVWPIGRIA